MERTLIITGKGKISEKPDLAIIEFPVESFNIRYRNARQKASIIAEASGISLKEILNINCSFSELQFLSETETVYNRLMVCEDSAADLNPTDINSSENVTVTWRIE